MLIERTEGLISAEVGEETVIMSLHSGYFYQLNRIASLLWKLLETPAELSYLCDRMQARFEIEKDTCLRDIAEFLLAMRNQGILRIGS